MSVRRRFAYALSFLGGILPVALWAAEPAKVYVATWRGCEEACSAFRDHFAGASDVELVIHDAGQDKAAVAAMLEEARAMNAKLILSWGTTVSLEMAGTMADLDNPAFNHDIPQIFMIVADPVGSGIVASLDATGRANVTGTYNRMPETVTVSTIRNLLPQFKTLGLIYSEAEKNSVLKRDELQALATDEGFELVALPLERGADGQPLPEDIPVKVRQLAERGADILYVGSSSFLNANGKILGGAAVSSRLPVISPYEDMVRDGDALISVAARYADVGKLAAGLADQILRDGKAPGELPVAQMRQFAVMLNLEVAEDLRISPPVDLLQMAEIVK